MSEQPQLFPPPAPEPKPVKLSDRQALVLNWVKQLGPIASDELSRVEQTAPTLWVPADVGLIEVDGRGCRERKPAPVREVEPLPPMDLGKFARWVSARPDSRHAGLARVADSEAA